MDNEQPIATLISKSAMIGFLLTMTLPFLTPSYPIINNFFTHRCHEFVTLNLTNTNYLKKGERHASLTQRY